MKLLKRGMAILGLLVATTSLSFAAGYNYTPWTTIARINIGGSGVAYVYTSAGVINPAYCPSNSRYALPSDGSAAKQQLALLLVAFSSGQQVMLGIQNSSGQCTGSNPEIGSVSTRS